MKNILFCVISVILCSCISTNYIYYVDKGDKILDLFVDSLNVQYTSEDICVFKETVEGESGDFINIHIQYYDKNKKLVAYKRISSFFNSNCYDGVLKEIAIYSICNKTPKMEEYSIYKENGSPFKDTLNCMFNYDLEYKLNFDYPESADLKSVLR